MINILHPFLFTLGRFSGILLKLNEYNNKLYAKKEKLCQIKIK